MKLIRPFILLTLTLFVLVSSTGITVGMHLCGGELQNLSFFTDAKDCPMEQKKQTTPPCHNPEKNAGSDQKPADDCCEDTQIVVQHVEHNAFTKASIDTKASDLKFIATAYVLLAHLFSPEASSETSYVDYASPPIVRDIPVLVQSFLI